MQNFFQNSSAVSCFKYSLDSIQVPLYFGACYNMNMSNKLDFSSYLDSECYKIGHTNLPHSKVPLNRKIVTNLEDSLASVRDPFRLGDLGNSGLHRSKYR